MSQTVASFRHPLLRMLDDVTALLDSVEQSQPAFLPEADKAELLVGLQTQGDRIEALRARALAVADDVAERHGARSAGEWLAHETRHDGAAGRRWQRLAEGLDQRWPLLAEAYVAGAVSTDQAQVIGRALDDLPDDLDADVRARAEEHLVARAADFTPRDLRILGRRVLDVLAPDVVEAHEAKLLEAEEQAAWDRASITLHSLGPGLSRAIVTLPDAVMDRWFTHLHAFTSLLERIPEGWLPQHGGTNTTLIVNIDADRLTQQLATAELTTGTLITAGEARRLACTAGILPLVLGGRSQPLDLGRARRLFSPGQRKAMAVRDRHCRVEGCEIPAAWCDAHHAADPWARGGKSDLADGVLLCPFHHHCAHDRRHDLTRLPDGGVRFHRRT